MTTDEIYNDIITEKEGGSYSELDTFNSVSTVSIYRIWIRIFAFCSKTLQELFFGFTSYIEEIFAKNQIGTLLWWVEEIKKFQNNDLLIFKNGVYQYDLIDEEKKIVKQVALETLDRVIIFKVASVDTEGKLTHLTDPQKDSLTAYINKKKLPGTFTNVVSQEADQLRLNYRIYYNALILKSDLETEIREIAEKYLTYLIFNGRFSITEFTDELQKITGVLNPVFIDGFAKNFYEDDSNYAPINDYYTAAAGYMQIAELTLQFIADV